MSASSAYLAFNRLSLASSAGTRAQWSVSPILAGPPPAATFGTLDAGYATLIDGFAATSPSSAFDVLGTGFVAAPAIGRSWAVYDLDAVLGVAGPQALSASTWSGGPKPVVIAGDDALSVTLADSQWGVVKNVELLVQADQVLDSVVIAGFTDTRLKIESASLLVLAPEVEKILADILVDGDEFSIEFEAFLRAIYEEYDRAFVEKPIEVTVEHAKRGEIDGSASIRPLDITLSLFSNGRDGDNGFHVVTGTGDDTLTLVADDLTGPWVGARDGRFSLVTAELGGGGDTFDASAIRAETIVRGGADSGWVEFISPASFSNPLFPEFAYGVISLSGVQAADATFAHVLAEPDDGVDFAQDFVEIVIVPEAGHEIAETELVTIQLLLEGQVVQTSTVGIGRANSELYDYFTVLGDNAGAAYVEAGLFDEVRLVEGVEGATVQAIRTVTLNYNSVQDAVGIYNFRFTYGVPNFGGGHDTLIAGQGRDSFHYAVGTDGADLVQGFTKGQDRIVLEGANAADLLVLTSGGDTIILPGDTISPVFAAPSDIPFSFQDGIVIQGVTGLTLGVDIILA